MVVLAELSKVSRVLDVVLADADPDVVATAHAADIVEKAAEVVRKGQAVVLLFTKRAAESVRWRDEGHKSPASWLAETTKAPLGEAIAMVETAQALQDLPDTTDALRSGELSFAQAKCIAPAARAHPEAETELLRTAGEDSVKGLRDACTRVHAVKGSAHGEIAARNAVHAARYLRTWTEADGAFRLDAKLTCDAGAQVKSALQAEADAIFKAARLRPDTERESPDAYRADALVALVAGRLHGGAAAPAAGAPAAPAATVHVRVDATALRRGHARLGEVCEIAGVGPVPVATVRRQLSDAAVKYFAVKGTDVLSVCHVGRTIPAHVASALQERDPVCVVPGCSVATGLEAHHWEVDYADCRTTSLAALARICAFHHDLVTYGEYKLEGGPGKWGLRPPPDGDLWDSS